MYKSLIWLEVKAEERCECAGEGWLSGQAEFSGPGS